MNQSIQRILITICIATGLMPSSSFAGSFLGEAREAVNNVKHFVTRAPLTSAIIATQLACYGALVHNDLTHWGANGLIDALLFPSEEATLTLGGLPNQEAINRMNATLKKNVSRYIPIDSPIRSITHTFLNGPSNGGLISLIYRLPTLAHNGYLFETTQGSTKFALTYLTSIALTHGIRTIFNNAEKPFISDSSQNELLAILVFNSMRGLLNDMDRKAHFTLQGGQATTFITTALIEAGTMATWKRSWLFLLTQGKDFLLQRLPGMLTGFLANRFF